MHIFTMSKNLGPLILIIGGMLKDLSTFTALLMIFIYSFGVANQALLYPNEKNLFVAAKGVFRSAYWSIYGELFLDEIMFNGTFNGTDTSFDCTKRGRCPNFHYVAIFLLAIYLIITNVLLLNLLIATFASTYTNIKSQSNQIWRFQRYELIQEYKDRPIFPPPLIIISHARYVYELSSRFIRNCWNSGFDRYGTVPETDSELTWNNKNGNSWKHESSWKKEDSKSTSQVLTRVNFTMIENQKFYKYESWLSNDYMNSLLKERDEQPKYLMRKQVDQQARLSMNSNILSQNMKTIETKISDRMDEIEAKIDALLRVNGLNRHSLSSLSINSGDSIKPDRRGSVRRESVRRSMQFLDIPGRTSRSQSQGFHSSRD